MATVAPDDRLLQAAREGDERAFAGLLEPYRRELHAHCYRMLGSAYDADDALQDASLRAWKALPRFEGRSSLRSWLYTIATNTCLTRIGRRPKRVLPIDYGPSTDPATGPGAPVTESVWIEPYPDFELEDGTAGPEARFEQRESVELAFIAALQHLPASQRAVLILREVLGFSAKEVAEALDTTTASVNSALQRARAAIEERVPAQSQQATLRALEDEELNQIVKTYVDAWERNDVEAVVALLTEDAAIAMPPLASWFGPRDQFEDFLRRHPLNGRIRWKTRTTTANGQPAVAYYAFDDDEAAYTAFALNVLTFRGNRIADVVAFAVKAIEAEAESGPRDERYHQWDRVGTDATRLESVFARFGLPDRLPADADADV
jgi:RNA polymerase sigma-70 factor, ECF subfamily